MTYIRPTISASRLKTVGGEKGKPGCERKLAGQYLFGLKQASSAALEFGSDLHTAAEHWQATKLIEAPESEVGRVLSAGAHLLLSPTGGPMLVEHEHVGWLPDGSPYVAYLDAHSPGYGSTNLVIVQDIKTTSNPAYALQGANGDPDPNGDDGDAIDDEDYDLKRDIQAMLYAWILTAAPAHWFCPPLPSDAHLGPKHWQWWDPVERRADSARLRWVYFLTKGVARAWEASRWVKRAEAVAYMVDTIMPLVAKINALHEWHYTHPHATLDEIDRNLNACKDHRGHYGRWCGVGEHEACNLDQLGTPVLDLVQLKVRKMTTPQERLAAIRNRKLGTAAPASTPTEAVSDTPAPASSSTSVGELTRGQKAAATRAARKAAGTPPPPAGDINPPEVTEALSKMTAPEPTPEHKDEQGGKHSNPEAAVPAVEGTTCPAARDLIALLAGLAAELPPGVSVTLTGGAK